MLTPQCIWPVGAHLGEGPIWQAAERAIYFVDIKGHNIHRLLVDTGRRDSWPTPRQPGFLVPADENRFICGLSDGLYYFEPSKAATQQFTLLVKVEPDLPENRLNDGYVDSCGRLWFGTMDNNEEKPTGSLYGVGKDGALIARDGGYVITNGPAISADGCTLYHTDTLARVIYAFDVNADGSLTSKRVFLTFPGDGYPDGMAVDSLGCLWIAFFGGWRIDRFSPQGEIMSSVRFPCANITKLAFGGDDMRTIYVTTATKGLSESNLAHQPLAGGLFSIDSPTSGLPQHSCIWTSLVS